MTVQVGGKLIRSDTAAISEALFLPYWFWGGVCALISLAVLWFGLALFWRATRAPARTDRANP